VTLLDFLSLKNYVNVLYLQKVLSKNYFHNNSFFVGILKVTDKNSRIQIQQDPDPGSGSRSTPKCHGSATLLPIITDFNFTHETGKDRDEMDG
jgi:hypothetical protein